MRTLEASAHDDLWVRRAKNAAELREEAMLPSRRPPDSIPETRQWIAIYWESEEQRREMVAVLKTLSSDHWLRGMLQKAILMHLFRWLDWPEYRKDFSDILDLPATPENIFGFHDVLARSTRWQRVPASALMRWLKKAIIEHVRDLRVREGNHPNDADRTLGALVGGAWTRSRRAMLYEFEENRRGSARPDRVMEEREAADFGLAVLARVRAMGTARYRDRDAAILDLLERGFEPAEAISMLGLKMSAFDALQKRARREMERAKAAVQRRKMSSNGGRDE